MTHGGAEAHVLCKQQQSESGSCGVEAHVLCKQQKSESRSCGGAEAHVLCKQQSESGSCGDPLAYSSHTQLHNGESRAVTNKQVLSTDV